MEFGKKSNGFHRALVLLPAKIQVCIISFSSENVISSENTLMVNLFLTNTPFIASLIDGPESYRSLVDYCDVFISCLDSHSDGTHSLQRIHWWASDVMLHFFKLFWWRNKLIYILDALRVSKFSFLDEFFFKCVCLWSVCFSRYRWCNAKCVKSTRCVV